MSKETSLATVQGGRQQKSSPIMAWVDALAPSNFTEAMQFAELMSKSDLVPAAYRGRPGNILLAVQLGAPMGFTPAQALQGIAVVNGKPSLYGDHALAVVKGHPEFESCHEWQENEGKPEWTAHCEIKRKGQPPVKRSFSLKDAATAKLTNKQGPWQDYRGRMLQMRARAFAMRDSFPDALVGLSIFEEAMDIPNEHEQQPQQPQASRTDAVRATLEAKVVAPEPAQAQTEVPQATEDWMGLPADDELVWMSQELGMNGEAFAKFVHDLTGKDKISKPVYQAVRGALSSKIDERNGTLFEQQ